MSSVVEAPLPILPYISEGGPADRAGVEQDGPVDAVELIRPPAEGPSHLESAEWRALHVVTPSESTAGDLLVVHQRQKIHFVALDVPFHLVRLQFELVLVIILSVAAFAVGVSLLLRHNHSPGVRLLAITSILTAIYIFALRILELEYARGVEATASRVTRVALAFAVMLLPPSLVRLAVLLPPENNGRLRKYSAMVLYTPVIALLASAMFGEYIVIVTLFLESVTILNRVGAAFALAAVFVGVFIYVRRYWRPNARRTIMLSAITGVVWACIDFGVATEVVKGLHVDLRTAEIWEVFVNMAIGAAYSVSLMIASIGLIITKLATTSRGQRRYLGIPLFGVVSLFVGLSYLCIATTVSPFFHIEDYGIPSWVALATSVYLPALLPWSIGYSVNRFHLFAIDAMFSRYATTVLSTIIGGMGLLAHHKMNQFLEEALRRRMPHVIWFEVLTGLCVVILLQKVPFHKWMLRLSGAPSGGPFEDPSKFLAIMAATANAASVDVAAKIVGETLAGGAGCSLVVIYRRDQSCLRPIWFTGVRHEDLRTLPARGVGAKATSLDSATLASSERKLLRRIRAQIVVALGTPRHRDGMLVIGGKIDGADYNREQLDRIDQLASVLGPRLSRN